MSIDFWWKASLYTGITALALRIIKMFPISFANKLIVLICIVAALFAVSFMRLVGHEYSNRKQLRAKKDLQRGVVKMGVILAIIIIAAIIIRPVTWLSSVFY